MNMDVEETNSSQKEEKEAAISSANKNNFYSFIHRCFLIEALLKCLGFETTTHQNCSSSSSSTSSSSSQQRNNDDEGGKEPSSTTDPDPPTDPPSTTEDIGQVLARKPPKPPVSHGSGPQIN